MNEPTVVVREIEVHVVSAGEQGPPGAAGAKGADGASTTEIVSAFNNGDPQLVFTKTGDTVTVNAA